MRPVKIQITLCILSLVRIFTDAFWIAKCAKFLHVDNKDWSDCAVAHTDFESTLGTHVRRYVFSQLGNDKPTVDSRYLELPYLE